MAFISTANWSENKSVFYHKSCIFSGLQSQELASEENHTFLIYITFFFNYNLFLKLEYLDYKDNSQFFKH